MAKENKNTHISYIIEFNATIQIKKLGQLNSTVTLKDIYTMALFFFKKKKKPLQFIHIDKLLKCPCYLMNINFFICLTGTVTGTNVSIFLD